MVNLNTASIKTVHKPQVGTAVTASTTRTLGQLYGDGWVNVKSFGAVGDGTTDDTAAIQAALDWTSDSAKGIIFFPLGTYKVTSQLLVQTSSLQPSARLLGTGSNLSVEGGSTIAANPAFNGFVFKCLSNNGSGNIIFEGLHIKNPTTGGGGIQFSFANHCMVRDCSFQCYYGVHMEGCNAPSTVDNCTFRWYLDSLPEDESFGVCLGSTGCAARGCDFVGYAIGVLMSANGNTLRDFRFELNHVGVMIGPSAQRMRILSTASASSGTKTRCTVASTSTLINEHGLDIQESSTNLNGYNLTYTVIDTTHFDLNTVAWAGSSDTTARSTGQPGNDGFIVSGGTFEQNDIHIWLDGAGNGVCEGFHPINATQGPNNQAVCNVYVKGGSGTVFRNCTLSGYCCQGNVVFHANAVGKNVDIQSPVANGNLSLASSRAASATTIALAYGDQGAYTNPGWLTTGLLVSDKDNNTGSILGSGSIPAGTTVTSVTSPNTSSITISAALTGGLAAGQVLYFYDPNTLEPVGDIYMPIPGGSTAKTSYISGNTTLSYNQFNKIWMNPGGGTIALTIPLDSTFDSPGKADKYYITQTGTGTANITAGSSVTITGLTSVGGAGKRAVLEHTRTLNTWLCYAG